MIMIQMIVLEYASSGIQLYPLHQETTPVPHWLVLIVSVIGLWVAIGGGVLVIDRSHEFLNEWVEEGE